MSAVTIVFPHQLFENHPAVKSGRPTIVIEEYLFFKQYNFHKQKLTFHRASMKAYETYLRDNGVAVNYIEANDGSADIRKLLPELKRKGVTEIHYANVTDNWLQRRVVDSARKLDIALVTYETPLFLLASHQVDEYFKTRKRFFQTDFYIHQRKHFEILVNKEKQPMGGKWSFDAENRLKYPKGKPVPEVKFPPPNEFWEEARSYVEKNFAKNYGEISGRFIYPTTYKESRAWLKQFFKMRFAEFGDFEDALVANEHILHHSVLTPMLNVGLLTPGHLLDEAIEFAQANNIPLNSLEGFIRQILGWREFIRGVYETKGAQQRTFNHWNFKRKIPKSFWTGTTGITPVDHTIKKILSTGYCHHIERLMVLGNFMLLCEFDPDDVYRWFMEMFIDAYDWVMVPNVYGMSQFADGGLMSTKPYISGSNYLMKMSDYKKGDWQPIWDGLFWRFLDTHRKVFSQNPRLSMLLKTFDKMPEEKQKSHLAHANRFLPITGSLMNFPDGQVITSPHR